jgi:nicotinate-nucleotide--dimethylbenzimidazole phosphoribosyltransferase
MKLLQSTLEKIGNLDEFYMEKANERLDNLIKPLGSLGKLEDICIQLAGIYESESFDTSKKAIIAFGGDHGVYEEGVASSDQIITKLQIPNYVKGISGVGVLGKFAGAKVIAVDVGINCDEELEGVLNYKIRKGTSNIAKGAAMTREEAIRSLEIGIELSNKAVKEGYKVLGIGEMGIGNTTPSSAIVSVYADCNPSEVTGIGAGLSNDKLKHKANIIKKSIELNNPNSDDAIDVLSKVGGFEIGAMAGVILGASANKVPVVLDGFISYASALIACNLNELTKKYMIASHYSSEVGSFKALELLGLSPMLNMDMRLGEGSGAALSFNIIEAANYTYKNMATFAQTEIVI